jgi:hypothetical protein
VYRRGGGKGNEHVQQPGNGKTLFGKINSAGHINLQRMNEK